MPTLHDSPLLVEDLEQRPNIFSACDSGRPGTSQALSEQAPSASIFEPPAAPTAVGGWGEKDRRHRVAPKAWLGRPTRPRAVCVLAAALALALVALTSGPGQRGRAHQESPLEPGRRPAREIRA